MFIDNDWFFYLCSLKYVCFDCVSLSLFCSMGSIGLVKSVKRIFLALIFTSLIMHTSFIVAWKSEVIFTRPKTPRILGTEICIEHSKLNWNQNIRILSDIVRWQIYILFEYIDYCLLCNKEFSHLYPTFIVNISTFQKTRSCLIYHLIVVRSIIDRYFVYLSVLTWVNVLRTGFKQCLIVN